MEKQPMIILTGPTAVGKTELSIALAKAINGAIISADSMQVYRYMDIGSAKITKEEMQGVKHYLVDELLPSEEFNIAVFQKMAKEALQEIYANGQIPIVVGGTGFYIQSLVYDTSFEEQEIKSDFRRELEDYAAKHGNHALFERLHAVDPKSCEAIHENNVKRVIRALEFYELTGKPISLHNEEERKKESPYNFAYLVLDDERENLYARIDKRVDLMVERGLVEEVSSLKEMGYYRDMVAMQGLGYKEVFDYLEGKCTLDEAIYIIKRQTRHFAKRQLTWFRREQEVIWINKKEYQYDEKQILAHIFELLNKKEITKG